ncbi:expressed unknown protein [Seminavis robusta]|uniref:Uncharacterized protein n=1 Tax=Seminavis robusta TaxID=568900 RepID=A0A9N8DHB6_9STRA|nr:expressed unknown protein [Seminavis robusta]|eukprot:Sro153_g069670.1 n/a (203) ;mRNA; r:33491-34099
MEQVGGSNEATRQVEQGEVPSTQTLEEKMDTILAMLAMLGNEGSKTDDTCADCHGGSMIPRQPSPPPASGGYMVPHQQATVGPLDLGRLQLPAGLQHFTIVAGGANITNAAPAVSGTGSGTMAGSEISALMKKLEEIGSEIQELGRNVKTRETREYGEHEKYYKDLIATVSGLGSEIQDLVQKVDTRFEEFKTRETREYGKH